MYNTNSHANDGLKQDFCTEYLNIGIHFAREALSVGSGDSFKKQVFFVVVDFVYFLGEGW